MLEDKPNSKSLLDANTLIWDGTLGLYTAIRSKAFLNTLQFP